MINHDDFLPIKANKRTRCFSTDCKSRHPNTQFYFTEWELMTGASIGFTYCENCILKHLSNIKQS